MSELTAIDCGDLSQELTERILLASGEDARVFPNLTLTGESGRFHLEVLIQKDLYGAPV